MHVRNLLPVATFLLICSLPALAQDKGLWTAASSSAKAITGEISIADARLTMNYFNFPIGQIRVLQPAEASALFDADVNAPGGGSLYRLAVAADRRFLHKNTLCGSDDVQWMVTWVQGRTLSVAFFSGPNPPVFTMDALANSTDRCGTFLYSR
ncbi:MAG: hypothetical protein ACLQHF_01420 [Terracidiphilus sp.]